MNSSIDISQAAYLLEHIAQLKNLTSGQYVTLALSSFGAAVTAGVLVAPINWELVALAFAGALISNVYHLLVTSPHDKPVMDAMKSVMQGTASPIVIKNAADDVFGVKK